MRKISPLVSSHAMKSPHGIVGGESSDVTPMWVPLCPPCAHPIREEKTKKASAIARKRLDSWYLHHPGKKSGSQVSNLCAASRTSWKLVPLSILAFRTHVSNLCAASRTSWKLVPL